MIQSHTVKETDEGGTRSHSEGPQKGKQRTFTIVGVDEADVKEARIAFTAPIARALLGKRLGEVADFHLRPGLLHLLIHAIE